jgi:hypothetical protein
LLFTAVEHGAYVAHSAAVPTAASKPWLVGAFRKMQSGLVISCSNHAVSVVAKIAFQGCGSAGVHFHLVATPILEPYANHIWLNAKPKPVCLKRYALLNTPPVAAACSSGPSRRSRCWLERYSVLEVHNADRLLVLTLRCGAAAHAAMKVPGLVVNWRFSDGVQRRVVRPTAGTHRRCTLS